MKFRYDHDLHIHSTLSICGNDPEQTPERIMAYAKENGLHTICLTDHLWDDVFPMNSSFYRTQNLYHITKLLPFPQEDDVRFLFGCETELDAHGVIGIAPENYDLFDFIIVPTTHMHMGDLVIAPENYRTTEQRAEAWFSRIDTVLSSDLPFDRVGLAHLTTPLLLRGDRDGWLAILEALDEGEMRRVFRRAAALGVGIELNMDQSQLTDETEKTVLRPYRIAHECGCKFYIGLDVHLAREWPEAPQMAANMLDRLELSEDDKHPLAKDWR